MNTNKTDSFAELKNIIEKLCGEGGCTWDQKQTHKSLKKYLIEETYETIEAIDNENDDELVEELGDVLYQVLFHAEIAKKEKRFDINDVIRILSEKMVRRHPHVFSDTKVKNDDEIIANWEKIKASEKKATRISITDGVPKSLPALAKAQKLQKKISKTGFDWDDVDPVIDKIEEELAEVKDAIAINDQDHIKEEIGDLLFSVVNLCRFVDFDAEELVHDSVEKFRKRFMFIEDTLKKQNKTFQEVSLSQMEEIWQEAKK